jgi:hypothetical protein
MGLEATLTGYKDIKYDPSIYTPEKYDYKIPSQYGNLLTSGLQRSRQTKDYTTQAATVGTPETVAGPDMTNANQMREKQLSLGQALTKRAAGEVPSAAEMQLNRSLAKQIAAQRAQAASARGVSTGMAQKMAAEGILTAQSEASEQAAQLRAQEQAQAEQTLGGYLSGIRSQDTTAAQMEQDRALAEAGYGQQAMLAQAGYEQEAALANQQARIQAEQQAEQNYQQYLSMGMSREEAQQKATAEYHALIAQQQMNQQQIEAQIAQSNQAQKVKSRGNLVSGIVGAAGGIAASIFSDERVKTNIKDVPKKSLGSFLSSLKGKSYDYKSPEHDHDPGDKHIGVMAQALEKTKLGKSVVSEEEGKKKISLGRALQLLLAGEGHLYREIQSLKKAKAVA